jgi:hypothetical protein
MSCDLYGVILPSERKMLFHTLQWLCECETEKLKGSGNTVTMLKCEYLLS